MNKRSRVVIGLDIGDARIGVAIGDRDVRIASPLLMLPNNQTVVSEIAKIVQENQAETVVVGLPRDADGRETAQSKISRDFAKKLSAAVPVPVVFEDESLTSIEAERDLRALKGFKEQMLRDGTLDAAAAALILTDYLERGHHVSA
jgi:putative Holliday junction resolvase